MHYCRAPHGARGLKYPLAVGLDHRRLSRPARGAWIEIQDFDIDKKIRQVAPRTGRVD